MVGTGGDTGFRGSRIGPKTLVEDKSGGHKWERKKGGHESCWESY